MRLVGRAIPTGHTLPSVGHAYRVYISANVYKSIINNTWSVSLSVRLSVTTFSATTRNKAAKKRYQRVQCHTGLILKMAIFVKVLRSKVMA